MIWERVNYYYQNKGIDGVLKAVKTKFNVTWRDRCLVNYYFLHGDIGDNSVLRIELERWKCYCKLRKKYQKYIDSLPFYELTGVKNKTIWWCWLQGENNAPNLCKACLNSLRKNLPHYHIVVVTEENMFDYVHPPKYIEEKFSQGLITKTHFSDILRTMLLVEHGGVWIDSTVLCTGIDDNLFDSPFFVFKNEQLAGQSSIVLSSWLISAEQGHPLLKTTQDLLYKYWFENDKLYNYFLFHMFFSMVTKKYDNLWQSVPRYSNIPPHYLQHLLLEPYSNKLATRIKHQSNFHKLTYKVSAKGLNTTDLVINKIISNQF